VRKSDTMCIAPIAQEICDCEDGKDRWGNAGHIEHAQGIGNVNSVASAVYNETG